MCCFWSDKMENTRNHLSKSIVLNEHQLQHPCHSLIQQRRVALRDSSHEEKVVNESTWQTICVCKFFKTFFWLLQVSLLQKKKVVMFLPVSLWHFVAPLHFERRGAFWIALNCHYHCDSAENGSEKHIFCDRSSATDQRAVYVIARLKGSVHDYKQWCKQSCEVFWKATGDSCHPTLEWATCNPFGMARPCHGPWSPSHFGNKQHGKRGAKWWQHDSPPPCPSVQVTRLGETA